MGGRQQPERERHPADHRASSQAEHLLDARLHGGLRPLVVDLPHRPGRQLDSGGHLLIKSAAHSARQGAHRGEQAAGPDDLPSGGLQVRGEPLRRRGDQAGIREIGGFSGMRSGVEPHPGKQTTRLAVPGQERDPAPAQLAKE